MTIITWLHKFPMKIARIDKFYANLFEKLPLARVMGTASVLLGITNILDRHSGLALIMMRDYHVSADLNAIMMAILILTGIFLIVLCRPSLYLYIPLILYTVITPTAVCIIAVWNQNWMALWFGVKAFCNSTLIGAYALIRLLRQGDET